MNVFKEGWLNFKSLWTSKNYVGFKGRATRREFWTTQIYLFIFALGAGLLDLIFSCIFASRSYYGTTFSFFSSVWSIVILLPSLALLFRRIHDTGHSGWWVLSSLILKAFTGVVALVCFVFGVFTVFFRFNMHSYMYMTPNANWAFLILLCVLGGLASIAIMVTNFVFTLLKGQSGANKYGEAKDRDACFKSDDCCCCSSHSDNKGDRQNETVEEAKWEEVKDDAQVSSSETLENGPTAPSDENKPSDQQ